MFVFLCALRRTFHSSAAVNNRQPETILRNRWGLDCCGVRSKQTADRVGRLRPILKPVLNPLVIQVYFRRRRNGIVMPDNLDRAAVPSPILLYDHYAIRGFLLGAEPRQSNS
jgi:hypothetical protein